jgi:hypothetical protein
MTHILTDCDIPGQKDIWDLAKRTWLKKHNYWPIVFKGPVHKTGKRPDP